MITSNFTTREVVDALELVCNIIPSSSRKQCESLVDQYGPIIVELVAELDDPNVVCHWLGVCQSSSSQSIQYSTAVHQVKTVPCNVCHYVVNYFDVVIQSDATENDFEHLLNEFCDIQPDLKSKMECKIVVKLYSKDIIKFVVEHADPNTVCHKLGICDA